MARSPIAVALAAALVTLLATVTLINQFGLPKLDYWHWRNEQTPLKHVGGQQPLVHALPEAAGENGGTQYLLGVGKADITGPVVEINFMGYADPAQLGTGLRQRLYSRAFIVGDSEKPQDRFVYLVLDTVSGDTAVRHGILEALAEKGGDYAVYGQSNVAVTGTHSHSGPGAWLNYLLPQITSKGFHKQSYHAIVDGAVASIVHAHDSLMPGRLSVGEVEIEDANINRSPHAYLANPEAERARYEHDVEKTMTLLRFTHIFEHEDKDIGVLTWFPVHGTSMLGNNTLVTGDNKGVAAYLFEKSTNDPTFVAGFSQASVGDTSPNVQGAYCEYGDDAGQMCDFKTSLCGNKSQACHGRGPYWGHDDAGTASAYEIGRRQFAGAKRLFDDIAAFTPLTGGVVRSVHQFVDFSHFTFPLANGTLVRTCPAALGWSFAAGTSDGPGAFDFKQGGSGSPNANPLWSAVGNRVAKPNETQKACQYPKPILLDVGESHSPYEWSPNIVDIQTLRAGQFYIIVSPGEATTMAGRRWKEAVHNFAASNIQRADEPEPMVVLGGPANSYTHYITTTEEYAIQRYEGASTLYGPHTLAAYINRTLAYLPYLSPAAASLPQLSGGPYPPILINASWSFIRPVVLDRAPLFKHFGDVLQDVAGVYQAGQSVAARFVGANPRNNLRQGGSFAVVERFDRETATWQTFRTDADWTLVYEWERTSTITGTSQATVTWETAWETGAWAEFIGAESGEHGELLARSEALKGKYRLHYYGDAKNFGGGIEAFEGVSGVFEIA